MLHSLPNPSKVREYQLTPKLIESKIYFGVDNAASGDVYQAINLITGDIVLGAWVTVEEACTTDATIDLGYGVDVDCYGNDMLVDSTGYCDTMLYGTKTWNPYLVYAHSENTDEIRIAGSRRGDHVSVSPSIDIADMNITAEVISNDNVAIHYTNATDGDLDLPSHTIDVVVNKAPLMANPSIAAAADTIDVVANAAITTGVIRVSALILRK